MRFEDVHGGARRGALGQLEAMEAPGVGGRALRPLAGSFRGGGRGGSLRSPAVAHVAARRLMMWSVFCRRSTHATGFHGETFPRETDAEARRAAELRLSASEAAGAWPCVGGSSARRASAQARAGRCARRLGRRGRFARCPRTTEAGGKADKGYPAQAGGAPALGAHVRDVATAAPAGTAALRGRGHGVGEPLSARCARAGAQCALRGGGGGVRLRALRGCARVTCCASKRIAWRGTTARCATSA